MAIGRRVAGAVRSLVNAKDLQLECARVLHETLLEPVLMYCNVIMIWKEKNRSRIGQYRWTTSECMDKGFVQSDEGGEQKGLMKVFYSGSTMWREWRMIGLLRESM